MNLKLLRNIYSPPRELLDVGTESIVVKSGVMQQQESDTESHELWHDIYIVTSGEGILVEGEKMRDADDIGDGEKRRGTLEGEKEHLLSSGTVVFIPAGCPHKVKVAGSLNLVVLKLRKK